MKLAVKKSPGHNTNEGLRRINCSLRSRNKELLAQIEELRKPLASIPLNLAPAKVGFVAVYFFRYQLARRGFSFYIPKDRSDAALNLTYQGRSSIMPFRNRFDLFL